MNKVKLWAGRIQKETDSRVNDFNSSIAFDARMFRQDIAGSIAHAQMLAECGIIARSEAEEIAAGLEKILRDMENGALLPDPEAEDIHMFVEAELTRRIGDAGKRLHTARSRNDQVALDLRLYLRGEIREITGQIKDLIAALLEKAEQGAEDIMPGYTHLQRAQPITFGHHMMAYAEMLLRDIDRFESTLARMDEMPLGSGALAGTTYPIDREQTRAALGFARITGNSLDGVSDRDYCIDFLSAASALMVHLSRFSEEIILWCSWEFRFVELDDAFSTGSSIMPQKKNPDVAELVRGKSGRVFGDLMTMLTVLKGLPLAYNKDLQEDKEAVFDAADTVKLCLSTFAPMIRTMKTHPEIMRAAAERGFLNATDCADYLVRKGLPFRDAYKVTGELVALCIREGTTLEELSLPTLRESSGLFAEDIYGALSLDACVRDRKTAGGPAPDAVRARIREVKSLING